jgi:DNA protecting protein DprA
MHRDTQEQACWLALAFESGLTSRAVNEILVIWCKQAGRTLQEFFAASAEEWRTTCRLKDEAIQKLEQAREKLVGQAFLVEALSHEHIQLLTVLDEEYPKLLKLGLTISHIPPVLLYSGDLKILHRQTIAIIGSRKAGESSLSFTRDVAQHLAGHEVNVISGNARGVDRAAYEGATNATNGHTTVVLPHGIRKLSKVQKSDLQPRIEAGNVLLLSQFAPDVPWAVSRAMERNNVVTGLAQIVIVAESDTKGGTWGGANGALKQKRRLYVRQTEAGRDQVGHDQPGRDQSRPYILEGNRLLIEAGGVPLEWPTDDLANLLAPIVEEGLVIREKQEVQSLPPKQLSLLGSPDNE